MNAPERFTSLLTYARGVVEGHTPALAPELVARSFTRTGGGLGPDPRIADPEPAAGAA